MEKSEVILLTVLPGIVKFPQAKLNDILLGYNDISYSCKYISFHLFDVTTSNDFIMK
jgi:hypothetical protein